MDTNGNHNEEANVTNGGYCNNNKGNQFGNVREQNGNVKERNDNFKEQNGNVRERKTCKLSWEELLEQIRQIFSNNQVDVDAVQELLYKYQSDPRDWKQFAHFDRHKYTRNLVDTGNGKYNLMLLCWSEGQGSCIHDHANAHCFMKVLSGSLTEIRFSWPKAAKSKATSGEKVEDEIGEEEEEEMKVIGETEIAFNDVTYMSDQLGLHRVENTSHVIPAVSLHLYVPPFEECKVFDQRTGHAMTSKVTFFSKQGKKLDVKGHQKPAIIKYN